MPGHQMQPHLIHPTLLDSFTHIGALLAKGPCSSASIVVAKTHQMVLSADFTKTAGVELYLLTTQQPQDARSVFSQSTVFQKELDGQLVPVCTASYTFQAFNLVAAINEGPFRKRRYTLWFVGRMLISCHPTTIALGLINAPRAAFTKKL